MAKTKISEFSATANSNTDINSINIAEGCAPSNINDAIRELMAELKDFQAGTKGDSFNGPVGTSTAAAGAFTTLSSTGNTTLGDASGDTVTINGNANFANVNPTLTAGTANGVAYLNGSKVLTTGSALTFDGTNFGIGTSSPNAKLVVAGGSQYITNTAGNAAGIEIAGNANTPTTTSLFIGQGSTSLGFIYQRANADLAFGINNSEQMRLTSTGLGIGTSSPSQKLDISGGNARISSGASTADLMMVDTGTTSGNVRLRSQSNSMLFITGGGVSATLDSSGNLGLGVAPSAWNSGAKALQYSTTGALWAVGGQSRLGNNHYYDTGGTFRYLTTGAIATDFSQTSSGFFWNIAPSGTAGNAITFTQAMTLDASGNLGVANTSPSTFNQVTSSGNQIVVGNGSASSPGLTLYGPAAGTPIIAFANGTSGNQQYRGYIQYDSTNDKLNINASSVLSLQTGGSERARIDSSGNLLVGTTSVGGKVSIEQSADLAATYLRNINASFSNSALSIDCDRNTNNSSYNFIFCAVTGVAARFLVRDSGNCLNTNNSYGALSDAKLKENITDATPKLANLMQVKVRNYNLKSDPKHKQIGVIAQELEQVFPSMVEESPDRDAEGNDLGTTTKSVKYSVFVPMLIKAMQEQQEIIEQLKADVAALKGA